MIKFFLGVFCGFFFCVSLVYGFGAYTTYKIHKLDEAAEQKRQAVIENMTKQ